MALFQGYQEYTQISSSTSLEAIEMEAVTEMGTKFQFRIATLYTKAQDYRSLAWMAE